MHADAHDILTLVGVLAATGLVAGFVAGLLGVGGGIVTVPVLEYSLRFAGVPEDYRMHVAVATSLAAIVPTAISSARSHHARGAVDCSQPSQFASVFTSAADAFPSGIPRPRAPELIIRSFAVPNTRATHVRLRVVTNQCTGGPAYQGDQDDDPGNVTDCDQGSTQDDNVRAAELQVFR